MEWRGDKLRDELRVRDGVESLGKIGGHDGGAGRGLALVEANSYCMCKWKEIGGS